MVSEITEKEALEIAVNSDWTIHGILGLINFYDELNSMVMATPEKWKEIHRIIKILKQAVKERRVLDGI